MVVSGDVIGSQLTPGAPVDNVQTAPPVNPQ
jgi:hypothetical protein